MAYATRTDLCRLRDDIHSLDAGVHHDILQHLDKGIVTQNGNGVFFDVGKLSEASLARIKHVVDYAKAVRGRLEDHDRKMFESAQRLVSGPVETTNDNAAVQDEQVNTGGEGGQYGSICDGEEAFCTRMEDGCVSKPAKGVFLKK